MQHTQSLGSRDRPPGYHFREFNPDRVEHVPELLRNLLSGHDRLFYYIIDPSIIHSLVGAYIQRESLNVSFWKSDTPRFLTIEFGMIEENGGMLPYIFNQAKERARWKIPCLKFHYLISPGAATHMNLVRQHIV